MTDHTLPISTMEQNLYGFYPHEAGPVPEPIPYLDGDQSNNNSSPPEKGLQRRTISINRETRFQQIQTPKSNKKNKPD